MRTLVAIAALCPRVPIVSAANRDELYARAAAPPWAPADPMPAPYGARHG